MLYYAANNVHLHGSSTNSSTWKDKVYLQVLKNSAFVLNLVDRFNMICQYNDLQARRSRRRILSEICLNMSWASVTALGWKLPLLPRHHALQAGTKVYADIHCDTTQKLCVIVVQVLGNGRIGLVQALHEDGSRTVLINDTLQEVIPEEEFVEEFTPEPRKVSKNMYYAARNHARAFGPGGEGFEIPHVKRINFSVETVMSMISYINNDLHIQQLACGSKTLTLSTGETIQVPSVARKMLRAHLWSHYVHKHTDSEGHYFGDFKKKKFMEVLETVTDGDQQTYAALDQIKVRCGTVNFESGLRLMLEICSLDTSFAGIYETHRKKLTRYREHCKSGLPSHLQTSSPTAAHCLQHLLGGQGKHSVECDHEHPEHCEECDYGRVFIQTLRNMASTLKSNERLVGDALEDMEWRISDFERKHTQYVGHIVRGYHEINNKNEVCAQGDGVWCVYFIVTRQRCGCRYFATCPWEK